MVRGRLDLVRHNGGNTPLITEEYIIPPLTNRPKVRVNDHLLEFCSSVIDSALIIDDEEVLHRAYGVREDVPPDFKDMSNFHCYPTRSKDMVNGFGVVVAYAASSVV